LEEILQKIDGTQIPEETMTSKAHEGEMWEDRGRDGKSHE
jgi:hypothetical protein